MTLAAASSLGVAVSPADPAPGPVISFGIHWIGPTPCPSGIDSGYGLLGFGSDSSLSAAYFGIPAFFERKPGLYGITICLKAIYTAWEVREFK
jgi:hypothetical protein